MRLHPRIKILAAGLGLDIRIGITPEEVNIEGIKFKKQLPYGFYIPGTNVIWINKNHKGFSNKEMQIVVLHEIGHAIIGFYDLDINRKSNEIKANAIALGYAALLGLPVSDRLIKMFSDYTKHKNIKHKPTRN